MHFQALARAVAIGLTVNAISALAAGCGTVTYSIENNSGQDGTFTVTDSSGQNPQTITIPAFGTVCLCPL
jgi:hypothetical protein